MTGCYQPYLHTLPESNTQHMEYCTGVTTYVYIKQNFINSYICRHKDDVKRAQLKGYNDTL